jgi:hypothetical protein
MVFQGLLIIDREDVNSQVFKGKYQLTELDVALTRVNQTLALKKVPFRLKAGFVERLDITGLFLTDAIDGHFDSDVSMTVKGVHLLFEVLTHAEVVEDAEKVKAALTPKKAPKKSTGKKKHGQRTKQEEAALGKEFNATALGGLPGDPHPLRRRRRRWLWHRLWHRHQLQNALS